MTLTYATSVIERVTRSRTLFSATQAESKPILGHSFTASFIASVTKSKAPFGNSQAESKLLFWDFHFKAYIVSS